MDNQQPKKTEIGIELPKEIATGTYSNLAIITHNHSEFVLDFARMAPGLPKAQVVSRVIMTPEHVKRLLFALKDNIDKYEAQHGEISLSSNKGGGTIPFSFGPNTPEA